MSCLCFSTIDAGYVGVMQMFGAYSGTQEPGCSCILWPCVTVRPVSLAIENLACKSVCKTKDGVSVNVSATLTYRISADNIEAAVFDIVDPVAQIRAEVSCSLRSEIAAMDVDDAYVSKTKLAGEVEAATRRGMERFGILILSLLVTELQPDTVVVQAMNEINQAKRHREASYEKGSADKTLKVKAAEAEAEAKRLAGEGMAGMRAALARGSSESMQVMQEGGFDPMEATVLMLTTQYMDTLTDFAKASNSFLVPMGCCGTGQRRPLQASPQQIGM
eukprot:TRINITY_DN29382_c0_g1_i1.p1 TRINITY_DN29382_c0_g1~~TRINITY_DN29382_c0_g1_i1.p1  ORF type:complete len:276 (-),score=57.37 TRINITY_DN29382_c0_g1_i1:82-909(-)